MAMNRIAILSLNLNGYGTERTMFNLALGFAERGIPVDLLLVNAEGPLLAQVPSGIRVIPLERQRVLAHLPLVRNLPPLIRYLRRERPAALLSSFEHVNIAALWARRIARVPTRVVVSVHFHFSSYFLGQSSRLRDQYLLRPLLQRFYPWADAIVADSPGVAEDMVATIGVPEERIRVIYNPVSPDIVAKAAEPLTHPWFAAGEPPIILTVGRLVPEKDHRTLIRAFHLVRQRCPARLVILGEGWYRPETEAVVRELGLENVVALPGYTDNPYAYMAHAAVIALSSISESFALVLAEGLILGKPIVATDCDSGPREILERGRWGTLVPVGDAAALAVALMTALDAPPRAVPSEAGERFRLGRIVDQYLELLRGDDGEQARNATSAGLSEGQRV